MKDTNIGMPQIPVGGSKMTVVGIEDFMGFMPSDVEYLALDGQVLDVARTASKTVKEFLVVCGGGYALVGHEVKFGVIDSEFLSLNGLSEEEIKAVAEHEKGHLLFGACEFAADAYAAKRTSPSSIIGALEKMFASTPAHQRGSVYEKRVAALRAM